MSHQKLKNIRVDRYNMRIVFQEKSNNDTSPYMHGDSTIPFFVHSCWGNIYRHSNSEINAIIKSMKKEFSKLVPSVDDLWWTFDKAISNDTIHEISEDLRGVFFKTCDKINNLSIN